MRFFYQLLDRYHFWKQARQYRKYNDQCWKVYRQEAENWKHYIEEAKHQAEVRGIEHP